MINKETLKSLKKKKEDIQVTFRANGYIHTISGSIGNISSDCFVFIINDEINYPISYDRIIAIDKPEIDENFRKNGI